MALEIKVNPATIESLIKQARKVPAEGVADAVQQVDKIAKVLENWEGRAKEEHDVLISELKKTLTGSEKLLTEILVTLDRTIDSFKEIDEEISQQFETKVKQYVSMNAK
ncbi:Proteins of 100 residues with WXG [Evansella caseinilytica]|uniref:Proteins of 100 residues with WXG n=1 Tax=Evansella caseinilytica TaxID=1503961 RepID=A0A1H3V1Y0_9BACI|nr:WXG100 family type VII secretion target [Evansella caseinilytica]SDZ68692.1 Proteins of 100 residues with WXG [Evansella caseinilytica]